MEGRQSNGERMKGILISNSLIPANLRCYTSTMSDTTRVATNGRWLRSAKHTRCHYYCTTVTDTPTLCAPVDTDTPILWAPVDSPSKR